jgi:hypothetical protein
LALIILSVALRFLTSLVAQLFQSNAASSLQKLPLSALPQWGGWIALLAKDNAVLYGVATMVMSAGIGFGANFLFNRKILR